MEGLGVLGNYALYKLYMTAALVFVVVVVVVVVVCTHFFPIASSMLSTDLADTGSTIQDYSP